MMQLIVDFLRKNRNALITLGHQVVRGTIRLFKDKAAPGLRVGDRVVVLDGAPDHVGETGEVQPRWGDNPAVIVRIDHRDRALPRDKLKRVIRNG